MKNAIFPNSREILSKTPAAGLSSSVEPVPLPPKACASAFADHLDMGAATRRKFQEGSVGGGGISAAAGEGEGQIEDEVEETLKGDTHELRFVGRALSLVRAMVKLGVRLRPETAALAQRVCAGAGRMGAAIEVRQAAEEAEKRDEEAFLGGWRLREKRKRVLARY